MPIIYLAGPITGIPNYKDRFHAVASALRQCGWQVMNPAELPSGMSEKAYMDIGLAMVRSADAIMMLDGWNASVGAQCELSLAIKCQSLVYYEDIHLAELVLAKATR